MGRANGTPVLGVALLDVSHYRNRSGRFNPTDRVGLGAESNGGFDCPANWRVPTVFAVAEGAEPPATLRGEDAAVDGLKAAVAELANESDLVITNCGFFWAGWKKLKGVTTTPLLLSGLDLLDLTLSMSTGAIGVLTYSEQHLKKMLKDYPGLSRLRIVGYSDLPAWTAIEPADFMSRGGWSPQALREQWLERTRQEFVDGRLKDVVAIVLECTGMPQYRPELRKLTTVPIFDVYTLANALLS